MKYFLAAMLLVLVGCATTSINFTPSSTQYFPTHSGDVAVLDRLPEKYQDVGWVTCNGAASISPGELIVMAKDVAKTKGANAIVYTDASISFYNAGAKTLFCRAVIQDK